MVKGIDVYIDGIHIPGFTKLTKEAKEVAKQKLINAIQKDEIAFHWEEYEESKNDELS